jgi:alpha-mannosidase
MPKKTAVTHPWHIVIVPHTHWDREWYFPYQRYRTRLVGFFDLLLDILGTEPGYRHFMLDGHTILIEDYLEVRPDKRPLIERYVRDGRLAAGPWYVIPDESLPSGEALVRNLLRGHSVARELGAVMDVGYLPDPFGQIAHLPAILNGFGIKRCVFWRGTDDKVKTTEFLWSAPDGSEVLVKHIRDGYGIGAPFPVETDAFIKRIGDVRDLLEPLARTDTLLVMWGSDHVAPRHGLSKAVRAANDQLTDARVEHGSFQDVFARIEKQVNGRGPKLPHFSGEFRSGKHSNILPGVLSARMWIKQRTFDCEQLLTRWAEPLTLWSELLRARLGDAWDEPPWQAGPNSPHPEEPESEAGLLDRAWRLLLENQPHDSICGCSVDQTHAEMRPRFDQCEQVADDLTYQAMRRIGAQGPSERVFVFNPLAVRTTGVAKAVVPARSGVGPVALIDEKGKRWPCQRIESEDPNPGREPVALLAGDVPGCGYRTYEIEYGSPPKAPKPTPARIENEFFTVEANRRDGTLTVRDKRSGGTYRGFNRLVDGGDRGDEYNYCVPDPDVVIDSPTGAVDVRVTEAGPIRSILEVRMTYRLPARLTSKRQRATRLVSCPVRVIVTLSTGVPRIDVRTEVENNAEDHRLRAHFPSGIATEVSHAEQHFGVVTRPLRPPAGGREWQEQPVGYHPQKTFVDVNDGKRGLMIANRGLPEYEALDARGGATIALTLLRCVGWLSRDDLSCRRGHAGPGLATPEAQMIGDYAFEYAIIPHEGGWARAYAEAHRFATPLRARWNPRGTGALPLSASFLEVDGNGTVVTALKRAEDGNGAIVRLYNTLGRKSKAALRLTEPWRRADIVDMNEDRLRAADVKGGRVSLSLKPNEIATYRFGTGA